MDSINSAYKEQIITQFSNFVSSHKAAYFKEAGIEFVMGKREGAHIWDIDGNTKLINCHCNGGVFNLGHRNQEIMDTLMHALQKYDIGNHHLISEPRAMLAAKLAELTPGDLSHTVFGVSGGEAIDLAIKIARAYTERSKIISALGGYHGHTGFALAAGDEKYRAPFGPMSPDFVQVPFNDLSALQEQIDDSTAAIILETIPATLGMPLPDDDYYTNVRALCDQHNITLIIDEVQTGLGRTGKLWGIEHYDVVPDIMVIGKGLSGGIYPISATIFKQKYESVFQADPFIHISTFGGSELACPVALKVLEISSQPQFLDHVEKLASIFQTEMDKLRVKYPDIVKSLRQKGLFMGLEMHHELHGPLFTKAAYGAGLLSIFAANDPHVSQILPPLTINEEMAYEIIQRMEHALALVSAFLRKSM